MYEVVGYARVIKMGLRPSLSSWLLSCQRACPSRGHSSNMTPQKEKAALSREQSCPVPCQPSCEKYIYFYCLQITQSLILCYSSETSPAKFCFHFIFLLSSLSTTRFCLSCPSQRSTGIVCWIASPGPVSTTLDIPRVSGAFSISGPLDF